MPMEEALLARLRGTAPVAATFGTRADWLDRPRLDDDALGATLPALAMTLIGRGRDWTHGGPDGLDDARVRFEVWAEDKAAMAAGKRAVLAEMEQARTVEGIRFEPAMLELERFDTDSDDTRGGGGTVLFRAILDLSFYFEEA